MRDLLLDISGLAMMDNYTVIININPLNIDSNVALIEINVKEETKDAAIRIALEEVRYIIKANININVVAFLDSEWCLIKSY